MGEAARIAANPCRITRCRILTLSSFYHYHYRRRYRYRIIISPFLLPCHIFSLPLTYYARANTHISGEFAPFPLPLFLYIFSFTSFFSHYLAVIFKIRDHSLFFLSFSINHDPYSTEFLKTFIECSKNVQIFIERS